ncbi:ion transporter, partial [bacterium]|nr:ion transporter [bacterium]
SDRYTTGRDSHHLPFSRVLDESRRYAENYASAELFAAPVLQAILCHKWESGCKDIFLIHFATYVIYLIVLTYLIMFDHFTQLSNCDRDTTACVSANWSWIICFVFSTLHVKYELHQLHRLGWKYFTSFWNQIGLASVLLTVVALALMQGQTEGSWTSLSSGTLRVIHTSALFSRWLKLLFFMRGLDSTAPLIKLLSNIMREMQSFLVLLLVLLTCFTFVFCLLLRDTDSDRDEFGTTSDAWLRTYGMMLGNFHTQWFDEADTHGLATCFFVVFTVSVPVIMLNALIAIMSDTYARSKTLEVANGRLMRADLILELESLIGEVKHTQDVEKKCHGSCMCSIWLVIQILLTFKISSNEQATGAYLHVLSFEDTPSGSEQEYELTSYPFKYNASDGGLLGAPTVAIGDVSQHERLPANKADVEKLMAQNVQLMSEMMEQREAQINLQEEIVRLRKE